MKILSDEVMKVESSKLETPNTKHQLTYHLQETNFLIG
jgi:hypothetical protein